LGSLSSRVKQPRAVGEVDLPEGDIRLDELEHLFSGLVDLDKYTVVDLQEPEELQDFPGFGSNLVDTAHSEELGELLKIASDEVIVIHTL